MSTDQQKLGIVSTISAYILWGFLPIYWKLLDHVTAGEILSMRIIWAFIFMVMIVIMTNYRKDLLKECYVIVKDKRKLFGITAASFVISLNWLTYIWAVNNGHVLQASLGYYINPLISILLGMLILKEKLTLTQLMSFGIAGLGVINLTISFGVFPWISLVLACSFATYGLLKKVVDIGEVFGLTIETLIVTPIALMYIGLTPQTSYGGFFSLTMVLFIGAGVATAVPLLLFAYGARRIPMSMLGFLQYIAPTIMLLLGIFVFKETFSLGHFISFAMIWTALILYMGSSYTKQEQPQSEHTLSS